MLAGGQDYSAKAMKGKEFSNELLTLFFKNANLKRLLDLHNLGDCPNFIFTTAEELQTQFQRLKIYPKLGAKGEIFFADLNDVVPARVTDPAKKTAQLAAKLDHSNTLCVDIAYYYVRVFQIYAALALTVIDADPTRKRMGYAVNPAGQVSQTNTALQSGGAIQQTYGGIKGHTLYPSVTNSPFYPIRSILSTVDKTPEQSGEVILKLDDARKGNKPTFFIIWNYPAKSNEVTLNGRIRLLNGNELSYTLRGVRSSDDNTIALTFSVEGGDEITQEFKKGIDGSWSFKYELGEGKPTESVAFFDKLYGIVPGTENTGTSNVGASGAPGAAGAAGAAGPSGTAGAPISSTGATSFVGFEKLKKIFEDTSKGGRQFPKTYCVARAMMLLKPLFGNELPSKGHPYMSQICKKKFDFEDGMEDYMPRGGTSPSSNVYLRSLVALYYDDYKYIPSTKKMELTQTESGKSELRALSTEFAQMYMVQMQDPGNFLMGNTTFRDSTLCGNKTAEIQVGSNADGAELLKELTTQVIKPMLAFQENHTKAVNNLLKQIFKIEKAKDGQVRLRITDAIKSRGKDGLNDFGRKAHRLLREYYRKSEAYYVKGVRIFETRRGGWTSTYGPAAAGQAPSSGPTGAAAVPRV
jgi:hypothetical protein